MQEVNVTILAPFPTVSLRELSLELSCLGTGDVIDRCIGNGRLGGASRETSFVTRTSTTDGSFCARRLRRSLAVVGGMRCSAVAVCRVLLLRFWRWWSELRT